MSSNSTRDYHAEKERIYRQTGRVFLALAIFEGALLIGALGLLILHGLGVI